MLLQSYSTVLPGRVIPKGLNEGLRVQTAGRLVSGRGQRQYGLEKAWILLTQEEIIGNKSLNGRDSASILGQSRADDGNRRKLLAEKLDGFRQDQVCLKELAAGLLIGSGKVCVMLIGRAVEVRKRESRFRIGQTVWTSKRLGNCIASLVVPQREMIDFDSADAQENAQNLQTACFETKYRIETRATLLNKCEV